MLVILLLAGALRLPGYNFSLPFIDQLDEPFHNLSARMIIDFGTSQSLNTHHYPPGIVMLNYLMLRLFHDTDKPPGSVVRQVRLVSVAAGIGTTLVIALLGYHALNPAAGLAAATLYAITPVFQVLARYATAEIYIAFLAMLAIWLAMVGAVYRRPAWTTWATYALMLAVLFKYHALILNPAGAADQWPGLYRQGFCQSGALLPVSGVAGIAHTSAGCLRGSAHHRK